MAVFVFFVRLRFIALAAAMFFFVRVLAVVRHAQRAGAVVLQDEVLVGSGELPRRAHEVWGVLRVGCIVRDAPRPRSSVCAFRH